MKLTTIIMIIALAHVSAKGLAQKITLKTKNTPIEKVLQSIKQQSGYEFFYNSKDLNNEKVSIQLDNVSIKEAIDALIKGKPLRYEIVKGNIILMKKEPSFLDKVVAAFTAIDIRGKVLDEKGQPLPGATVRVKNTDKVISTNSNGEFQLNGIDEKAVLLISFLGYKVQEIAIGQSRNITIKMEAGASDLEEITVVSTGYQTLPKERATGAFNVVPKEQLDKPASNIAQRLIGTTAGMQATLDADGNPRFEIRGQTSLNNATASPLVVVDGFPIQGDFSTINPNDVESVTVLKDAAAASIWGAKSANGVIVIVTRKGKRGTPLKVDFSAFARISEKLDMDYVNPRASSSEFIDYTMMYYRNWGTRANLGTVSDLYFGGGLPAFIALNEEYLGNITTVQRDALLNSYRNLDNGDQIRKELIATPVTQQYNLNLSNGSERMSNALSVLFEDDQSNFKGTRNKRYTINYRADADLFKWLQFNVAGQLSYNKRNNDGLTLDDIKSIVPYQMLRNEDGSLTDMARFYKPALDRLVPKSLFPYADWGYNPIQEITNRDLSSENLGARLQAGLKIKIVKGLSIDSKVQYEQFNTQTRNLYNENTNFVRQMVNTSSTWNQATNIVKPNLPKGSILDQSRFWAETCNFRNQINFEQKFEDKHEINFVGGTEISSIVAKNFGYPRTYGFNPENLSVGLFPNGPGTATNPLIDWQGYPQMPFSNNNTFSQNTEKYFSLFGNAAYTYNNKYTLSGSVRTDASNMITDDPSYRYSPFWSAGLGWQVAKESFLKEVKWIDLLNIRATYGYNGNVDRSTSFRPLIAIASTPNTTTQRTTATIASFGNPDLRWERTATWNIGMDYVLFGGQLNGSLNVYNKLGRDLIAELSIPAVNGTTRQKLNNARMYNRGMELELGTFQKIKGNEISWRGNLNFSYNKNKITKLFVATYDAYALAEGGSGAYVEGANASDLWRYEYAGVIDGQPLVKGANGETYDFSEYTPGDGRTYMLNMGTAVAPYTLGFSNSFQLYNFNFSFILTGKFGHVFQRTGFNYPSIIGVPNRKINEALNGDPSKVIPLPNPAEFNYYFWDRFHQSMSYLIESASHVRMQEVNLTYALPASLLSKTKLSRVQVFAQGNDLFTIVANDFGEDPEYPLGTLKPQPRVTLGFKCEF